MSYSDFTISSQNDSRTNGGGNGTIAYYTGSFTPPTPESGEFAREYSVRIPTGATTTIIYGQSLMNANASNGAFVGVENTKKIVVDSWIRIGNTYVGTGTRTYSGGLIVKGTFNSTSESDGGYRLAISTKSDSSGTTNNGSIRLQLYAGNPSSTYLSQGCSGTYLSQQWYKIRLEVYESGSNDILNAYVYDTGSLNWNSVGTLSVSNIASQYKNWGDSNYGVGFYHSYRFYNLAQTGYTFFDLFQAQVIDL